MKDRAPRTNRCRQTDSDSARPTWYEYAPIGYWETPALIDPKGFTYNDDEIALAIGAIDTVIQATLAEKSKEEIPE